MNFFFHTDTVFVDAFNLMEQGGRFGSPFLFENGTLCRAKVPDAHPRPDLERQAASVMVQKRAGHPAVRCGLAGGGWALRAGGETAGPGNRTTPCWRCSRVRDKSGRSGGTGPPSLVPGCLSPGGCLPPPPRLVRAPGDGLPAGRPARSWIHAIWGPGGQRHCRTRRMALWFGDSRST